MYECDIYNYFFVSLKKYDRHSVRATHTPTHVTYTFKRTNAHKNLHRQ